MTEAISCSLCDVKQICDLRNIIYECSSSIWWDRIKPLLLRLRRYCGRDMLIRNLQKFTLQNVSLNAAIEECRNRKIVLKTPEKSFTVEELLRRPLAAAPVAAPVRILPQ